MPLMRWPSGSSRPHAQGIDFLMMTQEGTSTRCRVLFGALEALLAGREKFTREHQLVLFDKCREKVEAIASRKYDSGHIDGGVVVVRAEDVAKTP